MACCSAAIEHALDAGQCGDDPPDLFDQVRLCDVDVGDLMIGHRERIRLRKIEQLAAVLDAHAQELGLAQRAVHVDRGRDRRDAVFGQNDDARAVALGVRNQLARDGIDLREAPVDASILRAEPLQVVVEVRKVDERQGGRAGAADMQRGIRDPLRGGDRRCRPPKLEQGKRAELAGELVAQLQRLRVAVRQLAAVRLVDRPRRDADVVRGGHVVPPEQIGGGERRIASLAGLPDLLAGHQPVGLPPQPDLHEIAEQPAIGDDAMVARQCAGHEGRLHAARHRRRDRRQRPHRAGAREGA